MPSIDSAILIPYILQPEITHPMENDKSDESMRLNHLFYLQVYVIFIDIIDGYI